MPAKGHAKAEPLNHRAKVNFTDAEALAVAVAAKKRGLKRPEFLRQAALSEAAGSRAYATTSLSPRPTVDVAPEDLAGDLKVWAKPKFSDKENVLIGTRARECGETRAVYMRKVVLADVIGTAKPKTKLKTSTELISKLSNIGFQIKKLGTNVNQLAHQANLGMVPLTPKQVEYLLNQHQLVLSQTIAILESFGP